MVTKQDNLFQLSDCTRENFVSCLTEDKADSFAKTFVSKADMQCQWEHCVGAFVGDELAAAIITTISKNQPKVANLQLLHTFAKHRGKGAAALLCFDALIRAKQNGAIYFRVSSEPPSVGFYEKIGFKFWGKQKSGCQLSIFKIRGTTFSDCEYDYDDSVIYNAVNRKGKGGCVKLFPIASTKQLDLCDLM